MRYERPVIQDCRLPYRRRTLLDRLLGRQHPKSIAIVVTTPAGHLQVYDVWTSGPYGRYAAAYKQQHGEWPSFEQISAYADTQMFDYQAAGQRHLKAFGRHLVQETP